MSWGAGIFENENATGMVWSFATSGVPAILDAFAHLDQGILEGHIIGPHAQDVLAACAIVAAGAGQPLAAEIDFVFAGADQKAFEARVAELGTDPTLVARCKGAITAIMSDPDKSELFGLWTAGSEDYRSEFLGSVSELSGKLEAAAR